MPTTEDRIDALESLVIDELARMWNCWPACPHRPPGEFDVEQFESWKDNIRGLLHQHQLAVLLSRPIDQGPPDYA